MSRTFGTLFLWLAGIITLLFITLSVAALAGVTLAAWAVGAMLIMGQPLLIAVLLSLLIGLELRFRTCTTSLTGIKRHAGFVSACGLIVAGAGAVVFSRSALHLFPAFTMTNLLIVGGAAIWLGVYLLRRVRV